MAQENFKEQFEAAVPNLLGAALDFTRQDPRVSDVWVLTTFEDDVCTSSAVYRVDGKLIPLAEMGPLFGDPDATIDAIGSSVEELFFTVDPSEFPNAMLVHYNVPAEEMDAEFSDERLPRHDGESYSSYVLRWAKEFRG